METREMRKRRELAERVEVQRELERQPPQQLPGGRTIYHLAERKYTYYNFLDMFLQDRICTMSVATMMERCEAFRENPRTSSLYFQNLHEYLDIATPALLAFHDVVQKVLRNHVASTREQRKRLMRYVTKAHTLCAVVVKSLGGLTKSVRALKKSIDEADGTLHIKRQSVPSDIVDIYRPIRQGVNPCGVQCK